jgi:hypothetical protein
MATLRAIFRIARHGDDLNSGSPPGGVEYLDSGSPPGGVEYLDGASPPEKEDDSLAPLRVMKSLFRGLELSFIYGLIGVATLVFFDGPDAGKGLFLAYTTTYRTIVSLGVVLGTAIIVYYSQHVIPRTVRRAFENTPLPEKYYKAEKGFLRLSVRLPTLFVVIALALFSYYCQFALPAHAQRFMLFAVCVEYGLAVYVGRKLLDSALMLQALMKTPVPRNLFRNRELDDINTFVHTASTLMIIFFYLHVTGYYHGDYVFSPILNSGIKPFLLLLAVVSTPVLLIFNFNSRAFLRRLYSQSIDLEIKQLQQTLSCEGLTEFEEKSYVMEVEKMCRDELRYSLQLSLNDLPIGITLIIMIVQAFLTSSHASP